MLTAALLWVLVAMGAEGGWVPDDANGPAIEREGLAYVPLASGGIGVFDVRPATPVRLRVVLEGRVFSRVLFDRDELLALETREEVTHFSLADPTQPRPVAATAPGRPASNVAAEPIAPAPSAQVLEVTQGRVVFDGGTTRGFRQGSRVRIVSQRLVSKPDLVSGSVRDVPSGEITAVLAIEQADEHRAMAVLGRGDFAQKGDLVELTTDPVSERLLFPRRAPFMWRAGFSVRPFLGLEGTTKPVGFLIDAYGAYYPDSLPLSVMVAIAPAGFVINGAEPHYPVTIHATIAYSTDYFEIGLGGGALLGNQGPCFSNGVSTPCEVNTGATFNQRLRLGAYDGLHLEWSSSIFARPDHFVFGVGRGELAVPLTSHLGLFGAGGGGENGWAFGEFGMRTAFGGAGASGTLVLSASLGYSSIFDGPNREFVGGPAVGFGMEWRL